jgi:hypothetical protein
MTSTTEALGVGVEFDRQFDAEVAQTGSLELTAGIDILGRDLAFGVAAAIREAGLLGQRLTSGTLTDIETTTRGVARRDSRVARVVTVSATESGSEHTRAEVRIELIAETDERGEFVLSLPP